MVEIFLWIKLKNQDWFVITIHSQYNDRIIVFSYIPKNIKTKSYTKQCSFKFHTLHSLKFGVERYAQVLWSGGTAADTYLWVARQQEDEHLLLWWVLN